jgi:hypothetical protein
MANGQKGIVHSATTGGVSGTHGETAPFEFLVAPSTGSEANTAQLRLVPLACWRVDDVRFAFDSSFVTPDISQELNALSDLRKKHSQADATGTTQFPPLSVFGHADPVGSDDYNKSLSGRRATVIYALLLSTTDPDSAVRLWQQVGSQESWGANQRQTMQATTGLPDGTAATTLIKQYMQKLAPADLKIARQDFLAQGADSGGKGDYQGCSEFNPMVLFSQEDESRYAQAQQNGNKDVLAERNAANAPNRRVMVLLFRIGTKIDSTKWPCPRATEGVAGCKKRFWSDGEKRRSTHLSGKLRKFADTQDTFACRFYQRLVTSSPCESPATIVKIRLFDPQARPQPFAPCLITQQGQAPQPNRATGSPPSAAGKTPASPPGSYAPGSLDDAVITISVMKLPAAVNVKWSRAKATENTSSPLPNPNDPDDFEYEMDVAIDISESDPNQAGKIRMKNLGYDVNPPIPVPGLGDPIKAFQQDYKPQFADIVVDGTLNAPTLNSIKTAHDAANPVLRAGSQIDVAR